MKLIDLLVQELPKRGGWKENWVVVTQDASGYFCCWRFDDPKFTGFGWRHSSGKGLVGYWRVDNDVVLSCDSVEAIITREQYESALAASQKPAWNGEGLPPVGCECEMQDSKGTWLPVEIIAKNDGFTFGWSYDYQIVFFGDKADEFRQLRTEAERKRDYVISALTNYTLRGDAFDIYDAIAAGKIPGVKMDK